jgi:hypothetical protein
VNYYRTDHATSPETDLSHLLCFGPFAKEVIKSGYTGEKEKQPPLHAVEKMPKTACGILVQSHGSDFASDCAENTEMTYARRASNIQESIGTEK